MLRIKQIGTICFAISLFISAPLFATDIPSSASTANCRNNPLQVYSGTSNLEAGWTANTIQLHWYNGDDEIQNVPVASQSCVYDDSLTPPSTIPTRTGYTFKGWRARQAAVPTCSTANLDSNINGTSYSVNDDAWSVTFSYGTISGEAVCESYTYDFDGYYPPSFGGYLCITGDDLSGAYRCKCRVTGYTLNGQNQCALSYLSGDLEDFHATEETVTNSGSLEECYWSIDPYSRCHSECADFCAYDIQTNSSRRADIFSNAGN